MATNTISALNGNGVNSTAFAQATGGANNLGKDAFLKLLISQLQHQDPLNPADSTQFTAQLAQFSSLEQLSNINDNLNTLKMYEASINNAQAVSFIGKDIVFKGKSLPVTSGQPGACEFNLGAEAKKVVVSIYDSTGRFVQDIQVGRREAGLQRIQWDGKDRNGNRVADGAYTFEVQAETATGDKVNVTTYSKGTVGGVTFEDGITYLTVACGKVDIKVAIGEITQIKQG